MSVTPLNIIAEMKLNFTNSLNYTRCVQDNSEKIGFRQCHVM